MKKDSLLYRYKKALKNRKNSSNDELNKIKYNYVTKLFFRIFLSTFILLCLVISDKISMNIKKIKLSEYTINRQWNFLNLVTTFNALFGEFIVIDHDINVDNTNYYDEVTYDGSTNYIVNTNNAVINAVSGVVTKISKDKEGLYSVVIQTTDNYFLTYCGLESFDFSIYNYIEEGEIIGLAKRKDNKYRFSLLIKKGDKYYDYNNFS